jgi:hypothetical protein
MGLLIPNEIATRWLSEHAIITLMLMLYSQCFLDMVVSVAGAPWKKEEGSMVKPRCDVRGCSTLLEQLW